MICLGTDSSVRLSRLRIQFKRWDCAAWLGGWVCSVLSRIYQVLVLVCGEGTGCIMGGCCFPTVTRKWERGLLTNRVAHLVAWYEYWLFLLLFCCCCWLFIVLTQCCPFVSLHCHLSTTRGSPRMCMNLVFSCYSVGVFLSYRIPFSFLVTFFYSWASTLFFFPSGGRIWLGLRRTKQKKKSETGGRKLSIPRTRPHADPGRIDRLFGVLYIVACPFFFCLFFLRFFLATAVWCLWTFSSPATWQTIFNVEA